MNEVFSYGEIGIDNIIQVPHLPSPENASFPTSDTYHIGGAAANLAVMLASWKIETGLSGNIIGNDLLGKQLKQNLNSYPNLDLTNLIIDKEIATPFCRIFVTPDGERSIVVFGYPKTPKTRLSAAMLSGVKFLALDLYGGDERVEAAKLAKSLDITTILNDLIWVEHPIIPFSDIIINSAAYVRQEFPSQNVIAHAFNLHAKYKSVIITTDGADPVHIVDQYGSNVWIKPPKREVLDATGAGDAFRAGLIYGLLQGWDLVASVKWATAAGSLKVSRVGAASSPPTIDEISSIIGTIY